MTSETKALGFVREDDFHPKDCNKGLNTFKLLCVSRGFVRVWKGFIPDSGSVKEV